MNYSYIKSENLLICLFSDKTILEYPTFIISTPDILHAVERAAISTVDTSLFEIEDTSITNNSNDNNEEIEEIIEENAEQLEFMQALLEFETADPAALRAIIEAEAISISHDQKELMKPIDIMDDTEEAISLQKDSSSSSPSRKRTRDSIENTTEEIYMS